MRSVLRLLIIATASLSLTAVSAAAAPPSVTAIAGGNSHTCAIVDGGADCWGANGDGQRGDGSAATATSAVDVQGLNGDIIAVAAGNSHSCAIDVTGQAWCWGDNYYGQLGDGTADDSLVPVAVAMPAGVSFTTITTGIWHSCAIDSDGGVWCWGYNNDGQLGIGTMSAGNLLPTSVTGLTSGVSAIAAGGTHNCVIQSGAVKCWGGNLKGQIGNNDKPNRALLPVAPAGTELSSGVLSIAAAFSTSCAIDQNGKAWCWGNNMDGQLGNGGTTDSSVPVPVISTLLGEDVAKLAVGAFHVCALDAAAKAWCWGANFSQQLGDGTWNQALAPRAVVGLPTGVTVIAAGSSHTCAVAAGQPYCWGANGSGALGNGTTTTTGTPSLVTWAPTLTVSAPIDDTETLATSTTVDYQSTGWPTPQCTINGDVLASGSGVDLTPGANTITVTCSNAGGSATRVVTVTRNAMTILGSTSPADGTVTQATQINVSWIVSGFPVPACTINGTAATSPTTFPLSPGDNSIELQCANEFSSGGGSGDGRTVVVTRNVVPALTVAAPLDNLRTTEATVDVEFAVTGYPAPGCSVNGTPASSTHTVNLGAGDNPITVSCSNAAGSDQRTINVWRGEAPGVSISYPYWDPEVMIPETSEFVFFTATGSPAPECKSGDDVVDSGFVAPLEVGSNSITVTCTNEFGSASQTVRAYRTMPGGLTIDSPADGYATAGASVEVAFTPTGAPLPTNCTYQGQQVTSPFTVSLDDPGPKTISVHCSNLAGGEFKEITVHRTAAPTLNLSLPAAGPVVTTATAEMAFWATGHPQPTCQINGVSVASSPATVAFEPGDNTVTLSCTNSVGTGTSTVNVTRYVAPQVSITAPSDGHMTLDAQTDVVFAVDGYPAPNCAVGGYVAVGDRATVNLDPGDNTIEVSCTNFAGSDTRTINVTRHSPLGVVVAAPGSGASTLDAQVNVIYAVNGGSSVPVGTTCTVAGAPSTDTSFNAVALVPGTNTIEVRCSNPLVSASASVTITRTVPPAPPAPSAKPLLRSAPKSVRAGKKIKFEAVCASGCRIAPTLKIGNKRIRGIKTINARPGSTRVTLKLPAKVTKQIKAALKKRKKTKIVLMLTPRSAEGSGRAVRVRIR